MSTEKNPWRMQKQIGSVNLSSLALPDNQKAFDLLSKALECVQGTMRRNNWRIENLAEFLPRGESLLGRNTNAGYLVEIRIRHNAKHPNSFLPFEAIVGTLLHELVHNSIRRHGKQFSRKLAKITEECETDMMSSIKIVALPQCGLPIGGDFHALRTFSKRELILFAAESRLAIAVSSQAAAQSSQYSTPDLEVIEIE